MKVEYEFRNGNKLKVSYDTEIRIDSYPKHKGRKGHRGGSLPRGIEEEIDELTPCLRDNATGKIVDTTTLNRRVTYKTAQKLLSQGWSFNWADPELKEYNITQIKVKGSQEIQGIYAWKARNGFIEARLIENNPQNRHRGKYLGITGHIFANLCKESKQRGLDGVVGFEAKTNLIEYYKEKVGAIQIGTSQRMFIDELAAYKLMKIYFGEENVIE